MHFLLKKVWSQTNHSPGLAEEPAPGTVTDSAVKGGSVIESDDQTVWNLCTGMYRLNRGELKHIMS